MDEPNQCQLDVDLAGEVQQLLFPKGSPVCGWCCMGVKNRMALGLGGDYFEFISMDDGCQVVFLGDVTGHGQVASVVMSLLYGFVHHAAAVGCDPLKLASEINDFLQTFAERSEKYDHYFSTTIFCAVIDPETLQMRYVNAGQPGPIVRRGDKLFFLDPTAPPLGFFENPEMWMSSFSFEKGDRILLYTDGLTEAANPRGHFFGVERLKQVLLGHEGDHLEFLEEIFRAMKEFEAVDPPGDDCTAIVIDFHGPLL